MDESDKTAEFEGRDAVDRPVTKSPTGNFGVRLKAAREARGITLRQIAMATKISMSVLEALERNDLSRLPGGIFSRSFVRSFAEEVGLDPERTVAEFLEESPTDVVEEKPVIVDQSPGHEVFLSQQRMATTVLSLVLLSLPVAAFLIFLGLRGGGEPEVSPTSETEVAGIAGTSADDATSESETAGQGSPPRAATVSPAALERVNVEEPPVFEPAAVGPLTIDIHPSAACWVSLTLDGERVFSRVMQPGEREVLEAEREIVVNVGDAGAFAFTINQRPGRVLGASGEVVTARINRENYRSFVTQ